MKAIISVLGHDRPGIIATISGCLYKNNLNILDITQTIIDGYFTMVTVVDMSGMTCSFAELGDAMNAIGKELGIEVRLQRSEIFDAMHRL